ncbi:hypothetical protein ACJJTC_015913 [Scirpophaga incertulas]
MGVRTASERTRAGVIAVCLQECTWPPGAVKRVENNKRILHLDFLTTRLNLTTLYLRLKILEDPVHRFAKHQESVDTLHGRYDGTQIGSQCAGFYNPQQKTP